MNNETLPNDDAENGLSEEAIDETHLAGVDATDLPQDNAEGIGEPIEAEARIEELRQELEDTNNRWLRTEAELDNFRKRARRETEELSKYATTGLLTELLNVVDNLDRAIEAAESNEAQGGLLEGVKMVATQLETTLEQHGCLPIETVGEVFDPNRHEAVIMEPTDEHKPQTIVRELRKGYVLHDRVIRPPQVVVAAPKSEA